MSMMLRDLGERALIALMAKHYGTINLDDCATIDIGDDLLLVSSDMVNEITHFPQGTTPYLMGWFIVAINLSDIAGAGGIPYGILLSLGLPSNLDVSVLEHLITGARDAVHHCDTMIIGGDTKEVSTITLCGTALGKVPKNRYLSRRGTKPGDVVCVTGELGFAGAALQHLSVAVNKEMLEHLLKISPRLAAGQAAGIAGGVTAAMDISDGLSSSLYQLMDINQVGFMINADKIPVAAVTESCDQPLNLAMHAGGDYELLMTIAPEAVNRVQHAIVETGVSLTPIGEVTAEKRAVLLRNGNEEGLPDKGYDHFRTHGKTL